MHDWKEVALKGAREAFTSPPPPKLCCVTSVEPGVLAVVLVVGFD